MCFSLIYTRGVGYEVDISNIIMQNIYYVFRSIFFKNNIFNDFRQKSCIVGAINENV